MNAYSRSISLAARRLAIFPQKCNHTGPITNQIETESDDYKVGVELTCRGVSHSTREHWIRNMIIAILVVLVVVLS